MIASKKIASDVLLFGLFWICIFGEWHSVRAYGDDSSIYLVDFDETAYDLYIKGYYPTDYSYADFRRDSIEGMVSHYVATDNNNFTAIVDTIENDVLQNGWSVIDNFFENAWIDLKSGVVTVAEGFTDDFKHELDGRFKISPSPDRITTSSGGVWIKTPFSYSSYRMIGTTSSQGVTNTADVYVSIKTGSGAFVASYYTSSDSAVYFNQAFINSNSGAASYAGGGALGNTFTYNGTSYKVSNSATDFFRSVFGSFTGYANYTEAFNDFYGYAPDTEPVWNGNGYYSDTPTNYSINLPALPAINWPSISNNNKTKYGVDFPDVDVSIDFQLPDMYYPKSVTYDVPYWLQNGDETAVDWQNVSFDDVTLPSVELSDGDGTFFQNLFLCLPVGFASLLLGVILCYLIFLLL